MTISLAHLEDFGIRAELLTGLVRLNLGSTRMSNGSWRDRLILRLFLGDDLRGVEKEKNPRHQKLAELGEARALVVEDPDILGGTAVIRNTRVPVYDVAASVAAGLPMKRILAAYPGLTAEMAKLAAFYATANPPRGRPREHSSPPAGALIGSTRRTPRRKRNHEAAR
jgi:uncharacterized protein (DUF433 family)